MRIFEYIGVFALIFALLGILLFKIDFYPELVMVEETTITTEEVLEQLPEEEVTVTLSSRLVPVTFVEAAPPATASTPTPAQTSERVAQTTGVYIDPVASMEAKVSVADKPTRIIIDDIGVDVAVKNPLSRDIEVLDSALLYGAVRFPGSGSMIDNGNMFIFAHSSGLPNIRNQNFKAFNNIGKLTEGALIKVQNGSQENIYKVVAVRMDQASDVRVDFTNDRKRLTLATCNSFGTKQDRFIVEADFVGSYPLSR